VLENYTNADIVGDINSRKSTTGCLTTFARGAISWQYNLQKCVALSTTEVEYIATTEACKDILWMKTFLLKLGYEQEKYLLRCDSLSAIHIAQNSTYHSHSKHIDVSYYHIWDVLKDKLLQFEKIHTYENWSGIMSKVIPIKKFEKCIKGAVWCFPIKSARRRFVGLPP